MNGLPESDDLIETLDGVHSLTHWELGADDTGFIRKLTGDEHEKRAALGEALALAQARGGSWWRDFVWMPC